VNLPADAVKGGLSLIGENVEKAEVAMLEMEQAECSVVHRFGPGICIREVSIPAGTLAIGHHQNFEHTNIMLKGHVTILNDDGSTTEMDATESPIFYIGKPGRKIGYIHTDMVWQNIYATEETDIDAIEDHFVTKSDGWQASIEQNKGLLKLQHMTDTNDYQVMLDELGITDESLRTDKEIKLPCGGYKIKISDSEIEGKGLFATAPISVGEKIADALIYGVQTIAYRYANHSKTPNAKMVSRVNNNIYLEAIRDISGCHGGFDGEEITVDYRDSLTLLKEGISLCQS